MSQSKQTLSVVEPDARTSGTSRTVTEPAPGSEVGPIPVKPAPAPPINFYKLYRYATKGDILLLLVGVLAAIAAGTALPLMTTYFGRIVKVLVSYEQSKFKPTDLIKMCGKHRDLTTIGPQDILAWSSMMSSRGQSFVDEVISLALVMSYVGVGAFVTNAIYIAAFNIVSENQVFRIRKLFLESLLRQDVGWYDTVEDRNFVSRMSDDLGKIQEATGEKVGLYIYFTSTFVLCIANAFWHGWLMTLVVMVCVPLLGIAASIVSKSQAKASATEHHSYAKAGTIAQEAITNIKTVMAFCGSEKEVERYLEGLRESKVAGRRRGAISSFGMGLMWLIIYSTYSLAFWYGIKKVLEGRKDVCNVRKPEYGPDTMIIVFLNVIMGAFNGGQAASTKDAFANGRGAASGIYSVIDRVPKIDSYSEEGKKPLGKALGKIEFKEVNFFYPSRLDIQVLKNFNLNVEPGQTVALVGESGCGKSTCIQLLQRFYDPTEGSVSLDGEKITDLHIGWLRSQIGVVSQEPVLFNTTIAENIRYGREDVTQMEIEEACMQSNAHGFIRKLPNKYETVVGDRGAALSGGQKQRIAIARSLVRNPAILLLDEATSALDFSSEAIVQEALDKAKQGRTTIIVAHRLSTIRNADVIVAINQGQVQEQGTHDDLLKLKGLYYSLVQVQGTGDGPEEDKDEGKGDDNAGKRQGSVDSMEEEIILAPKAPLDEKEERKRLAKETKACSLLSLNKKEWPYILVGVVAAFIHGGVMPAYAIIFGEVLTIMTLPNDDEVRKKSELFAIIFLVMAFVAGISTFLQLFMFSCAGEALTQRLRKLTFEAMLRQELGWFDEPQNNIGSLCARLSGDAAAVQGATGSRVGILVQCISTVAIAIGVGMYYSAKLGAVALAFVPFVLVATYFQGRLLFGANVVENKAVEESSKIAVQAVGNIRTVASLCKERRFVQMYTEILQKGHDESLKLNLIRGLVGGLSQSVVFFGYSAINSYGSTLVEEEGMPFGYIFKVSQALILGTMMVGQALSFQPNYSKAKISGARVLALLARKPKIDNSPGVGVEMASSKGAVKLEKVAFHYPTRPSAKILRGLSMAVQAGTSVALVGPSGCGKSTTIQLILRYYDPIEGTVRLDDFDVSSLQVDSLRSQMAIVAQEPALFDRTIGENIAYGDNSRSIPMDEIISAAKMANIHSFIASLPSGYETRVGEMGTQLSGGQKQRVAIARALVRNPKIILLDEACSALDVKSEKIVQAALDQASSGRTSITIAHRLSSIQNVNNIIVINHGQVYEEGPHQELLAKKGLYSKLWNLQAGGHGIKKK